jgi:hypothetical protein
MVKATHTADEVPYTLDVEACADTGLHGYVYPYGTG